MADEEDYLLLSGIQHFAFCRRQWALIHIEQMWKDNLRTTEGQLLHERVHEATTEKRRNVLVVRDLHVVSNKLRMRGACDVVEFLADENGITLHGKYGAAGLKYLPLPVEYKRGEPKEHNADLLQLCAQAICLEEMLVCNIAQGALFYGETRRRLPVSFDSALREEVYEMAAEMQQYFSRGYTPKAKPGNHCRSCSLQEVCLPKLFKAPSVQTYLDRYIEE